MLIQISGLLLKVIVRKYRKIELGSAGLRLARAQSIEEARRLIGDLSPACRAALARLYLRFLARCAAARGDAN